MGKSLRLGLLYVNQKSAVWAMGGGLKNVGGAF